MRVEAGGSGVIERWRPYLLSIALHAALVIAIVIVGAEEWRSEPPAPVPLAIEAVAIDGKEFAALTRPPRPVVPEPLPAPAATPEPTPEPTPAPAATPKPVTTRKAAERPKAEERRKAEDRQKAEERQKVEEQRKAETVRKAEERRLADALAEEERRRRDEARVRAERESALQRALADETAEAEAAAARRVAAARAASLSSQWAAAIQARIERAWIRPPSARAGLDCRVFVTQAQGGTVLEARVGDCNGDGAVRQSLEAAVFRASPLPPPPEPSLFERNIELRFRPND